MKKKVCLVSFLQAVGLILYVSLVSVIFWKGNAWFGKMNQYLGPLIVLTVFAVSALISAIITLGYPFLVWQKDKKPKLAVKIVIATAGWVLGLVILSLTILYIT